MIIAAYCPCKSKNDRQETVYMQHKRHLMSLDQDECPLEAFCVDLSAFINSHQKRNEQIVLCLDLSENTARTNGPIQQTLMHTNDLTDALKHKHGSDTPATHNRGSHMINAIFVSDSLLDIEKAGWLRFGKGIGDHRIAYVYIKLEYLINKDKYEIITSTARRLQVKNEKAVRRYVTICKDEFRKHDILKKTVNIRNKLANGVTDKLVNELNQINQLWKHIVLKAERKCRKVKTGQVPFAPDDVQLYS